MVSSFFKSQDISEPSEANENLDPRDQEIDSLKQKLEQQKELLSRAADVMIKEINKKRIDEISQQTEIEPVPKIKAKKFFGSLVKVTWRDISSYNADWVSRHEIEEINPVTSYSVGWLVKETRDYVILASSCSPDKDQYCGITTIPRSAILQITHLSDEQESKATSLKWKEA